MSDGSHETDELFSSNEVPHTLRGAREAALQLLYRVAVQHDDWSLDDDSIAHFWRQADAWASSQWKPNEWRRMQRFANNLVEGVTSRHAELDQILQKYTEHWSLDRMSAIDRSILRLAAYELIFGEKTPYKTVLNEAVELAKRFGDDDSSRFVNGILDRIARNETRLQSKAEDCL